jgi:hypothetical protein
MTLDWPEEEGEKLEGKERIKLDDLEEATWDLETETLRRAPKPAPATSTGD